MRVPVQVMVGGKTIKIVYPDEIDNDTCGDMDSSAGHIRISKKMHKGRSVEDVCQTIFHEMIHFALEYTGHNNTFEEKQEEALVCALEYMLAPLFVFSPSAPVKWKDVDWPEED